MAAIRHTLQRDVFQPNDEHLLAVVHVSKLLKKKKSSFLCIAIKTEKPICVTIYQVQHYIYLYRHAYSVQLPIKMLVNIICGKLN
jgi:hypothetical protein